VKHHRDAVCGGALSKAVNRPTLYKYRQGRLGDVLKTDADEEGVGGGDAADAHTVPQLKLRAL
jgi:hypothetical protein